MPDAALHPVCPSCSCAGLDVEGAIRALGLPAGSGELRPLRLLAAVWMLGPRAEGGVVSHDALYRAVWGAEPLLGEADRHVLRVQVARARLLLDGTGHWLHNAVGRGYRLTTEPPPPPRYESPMPCPSCGGTMYRDSLRCLACHRAGCVTDGSRVRCACGRAKSEDAARCGRCAGVGRPAKPSHDACPDCGKRKKVTSRRCIECERAARSAGALQVLPCPDCGGTKYITATRCLACRLAWDRARRRRWPLASAAAQAAADRRAGRVS